MAATRSGLAKRENAPLISSPVRSPEIYGPSAAGGSRPVTAAARAPKMRCSRPTRCPAAPPLRSAASRPRVEAGRVLRFRRRAADHRVMAQERVHLAGEVGREARDAPGLHLDPLRMRAGQADQPVRDARAENQRLLAAHHVDRAGLGLADEARHDVAAAAAFEIDLDHGARRCPAGPPGRSRRAPSTQPSRLPTMPTRATGASGSRASQAPQCLRKTSRCCPSRSADTPSSEDTRSTIVSPSTRRRGSGSFPSRRR